MDYHARVIGGGVSKNPSIPRTPTLSASPFASDLSQRQGFVANQPQSPFTFEGEELEAPGSKGGTKRTWQPTLNKEQSSKQKYGYESYLSGQTLTSKLYPPLSSSNFFNLPLNKGVSSPAEWSSDERYRDLFPNYRGQGNCSDPYGSTWSAFPSHPDSGEANSTAHRYDPSDKDSSQSQHTTDDSGTGSLFRPPLFQTEHGDARNGEMTHSVQYDFLQNEWDVQINEPGQTDDEPVSLNELFQDTDVHSLQTIIQGGPDLDTVVHRLLGSFEKDVKNGEELHPRNGTVHDVNPSLPTGRHLKPDELGDCSSLTSDEKLLLGKLLSKMNHRTVTSNNRSKQEKPVVKNEAGSSDQSQEYVRKRSQETEMATDVTKRNHSGESKNLLYASPTPSKHAKLQLEKTLKKQKKIQPVTVVNLDSVLQESCSSTDQRKKQMDVEEFNVSSSTTMGKLDGTGLSADAVKTAKRCHQGLNNSTGELETITPVVKKTKKKKRKKKQGQVQVCGREMHREEARLEQQTKPDIPKDAETGVHENRPVSTDGDKLVHSASEQTVEKNNIQSDTSERLNIHPAMDEVDHMIQEKQVSTARVMQTTEASSKSYADTLKREYSNAEMVKKPTMQKHVDSISQPTSNVSHLMSKHGNSQHKETEELVSINQRYESGVNERTQNTSQSTEKEKRESKGEKAGTHIIPQTIITIRKEERNQEKVDKGQDAKSPQMMRTESTRKERVKGLKGLPLQRASSKVHTFDSLDKGPNKEDKVIRTESLSEAALPTEPCGRDTQKKAKKEKKNCNNFMQTGQKSQSTKGQVEGGKCQVPKSAPMKSGNSSSFQPTSGGGSDSLPRDSKGNPTSCDREKAADSGKTSADIPNGEEKQGTSHSNIRGKGRCQKKKHESPTKTSKPDGEGSSKVKKEIKNGSVAGTAEEKDKMKTREDKRWSINWSGYLPSRHQLQEGATFVLSIVLIVLLCVVAHIASTFDYFQHLIVALLWDALALCRTYLPIILSKLLLVKHLWTYVLKPAMFITVCTIALVLWGAVKIVLFIFWMAGYKSNTSNQDGRFEEDNGHHQNFQNEQFRHDKEFPNFGTDKQERFTGSAFRENMKGPGPFPFGHSNSTEQGSQGHTTGNGHIPGSRTNENSCSGNGSRSEPNRSDSSNEAEQVIRRILNASDNPYEVLCIDCDVAQEVIKKEYRRLAVLIHPDKSQHPDAQRAFQKLQAAHEQIGDEESRFKYQMERDYHTLAENLRAQCERQFEELQTTIRCECGQLHKKIRMDRSAYQARFCSVHRTYHPANDNDIWVETSCMGLKIHCFVCDNGVVYDVTTWASCQRFIGRIEPNCCKVQLKMAHSRPPQYNLNSDFEDFLRSFGATPPRGGDGRRNRSSFPNNKKRNKRGGRR